MLINVVVFVLQKSMSALKEHPSVNISVETQMAAFNVCASMDILSTQTISHAQLVSPLPKHVLHFIDILFVTLIDHFVTLIKCHWCCQFSIA